MRIETKCIQSGWEPKNGEPRMLPVTQSTTFKFDSSEQMAKVFDLHESQYFYTRLQNPTSDAVARKICALEGGSAAVLTASGMAATFYAILNICQAGDHVVSSSAIYGGSYNLLANTLPKMGITATFVGPHASEEELEAAFTPKTKAVFGEVLSNPSLNVLDIERFAEFAHRHGVPLIVDNTFPTPINCRPFEWGADIVVHSTTKYMDGHATALGGVIVDSGKFNWAEHAERFPGITAPDETYHGDNFLELFGQEGAFVGKIITTLLRDLGATAAPQNAFLLNIGLETLHLRIPRHCDNALAVAEFLSKHPKVAWVEYPGLESSAEYPLAQKYMPNGSCGVLSFGVKGGRDAATRFMDSLELATIATHVADARTCVLHPASTTHRQMNDQELEAAGVKPDLIRFSVGIENINDILEDLEKALAKL